MAYCGIKNYGEKGGIKGYYVPKLSTKIKVQGYRI